MRLPYMQTNTQKRQQQIISFRGLNYGEGAVDGELAQSENLTTARFPCLSQRPARKDLRSYPNGVNIFGTSQGKLVVVDGDTAFYDGQPACKVTPGEKHILSMGTKVLIYPDAVSFDTGNSWGGISSAVPVGSLKSISTGGKVSVTVTSNKISVNYAGVTTEEADSYETVTLEAPTSTYTMEAPAEAEISMYAKRGMNEELGYFYGSGNAEKTTFGALTAGSVGKYTFYGCSGSAEDQYGQCKEIAAVATLPNGNVRVEYSLSYFTVTSFPRLDQRFQVGDTITLTRNGAAKTGTVKEVTAWSATINEAFPASMQGTNVDAMIGWKYPELSILCQSDNRIWGAEGNTIYASALGDASSFYQYKNLSTDSYAAAVASEGEFTGAVAYSGSVLFFKEDCIHKVLGNYPAQYEIYTYQVPGVMAGAEQSLCNLSEVLYYQGRSGIYAYTGGTPELISEKFGLRRFRKGRAGTDGARYYISMQDESGAWGLYTFDPALGFWLREDGTHAAEFARVGGTLYYLDTDRGQLVSMETDTDPDIAWSATLCRMDETSHGRKGYSKLYLRTDLSAGGWIKAEISTDGGPFRQVYQGHNSRARTLVIPILPQRCDNFQIRLSGKGQCIVRSLVREFSLGSEY